LFIGYLFLLNFRFFGIKIENFLVLTKEATLFTALMRVNLFRVSLVSLAGSRWCGALLEIHPAPCAIREHGSHINAMFPGDYLKRKIGANSAPILAAVAPPKVCEGPPMALATHCP
jgi:hypothetical protein